MATGKIETDMTLVSSIATEVVEKSVTNDIKNANYVKNIPTYKDIICE